MAKSKVKTERKSKPKVQQQFLPDMEPPTIQPIEDATANYYEAMMERTKLSKEEHEKKDALIDVMKENGIDRYETANGIIVTVTGKSNVVCKRKKSGEENGEAE